MAFLLDFLVGSLAFWVQDVRGLIRVKMLVGAFLAGQVIPLALFPPAVTPLLQAQPFRYTLSFPLEILTGAAFSARPCRRLRVADRLLRGAVGRVPVGLALRPALLQRPWGREVGRYLRLWRRFAVIAVARETSTAPTSWSASARASCRSVLAVLTFLLLYRFTTNVAGWSQAQALVLVGVYRMADGLIGLQIAPNMFAISGYIRRGEMDFLLMRPVSSQFLASARNLSLPEAVNAAIGLGLVIYAGDHAGIHWSAVGVAEAIGFRGVRIARTLCAVVLHRHALVLADTGRFDRHALLQPLRGGALSGLILQGRIRTILTFAVPVAFATTFPVQALSGRADVRLLPVGLALAAAALVATHLFWNYAVRHYSSASS